MSKKQFKRPNKGNAVQAVFTRYKKDKSGNLTTIPLYDIYGSPKLKRH